MRLKRRLATAGVALGVVAAATGTAALTAQADPAGPTADDTTPVAWNVDGLTATELTELESLGFDIAEAHDGRAQIIGDAAVADELRDLGHDPEFHDTVYKAVDPAIQQEGTYYGGYRTVDAYEADLQAITEANPDLTVLHDIGDSWLKTQGQGGHDLLAVCLTKLTDGDCETDPDSVKPRFTLMAQIHAREIATGEIAWRWIEKLVDGYGTDPEVTELLDTTEVWVVPIVNPDGVDIVASGGNNPVLQRKNANDTAGNCGSRLGIDLNRNSSFEWGNDSTNPCAETYQGATAASEPETQAIEAWLRDMHPDQRGPGANDPAPDDARDVFITLHSYGNYIIIPYGYTADPAPNDTALRALGADMAEYNGYFVGTNDDTVGYGTSGTTDDMAYGELGVAAFTFEVGGNFGTCGGFFPAYTCVDASLWPENEGALLTAAQAAAAPYAS
ncbi:M14 family zinc carboxypeptidase [Glycomyces sp. NPDC046736]|uniref:M14 family zinc carboxypeptidase n=1 Tax=Glycomyces sp. NPDC046736 TaxID=3155615 RepID=UPI003400E550